MGGDDRTRTPWRVQWHVTADGTVILERSRGDQAHQRLFQVFETTRPVTVAELDSLSSRSDHEMRRTSRFDLVWWTGMLVYLVGLTVLGGLVGRSLSDELVPGLVLGAVAALLLAKPAFWLVALVLPDDAVGSVERLWQEAGLTSPTEVTTSAAEARAMVEAPGTTSGAETWVEQV